MYRLPHILHVASGLPFDFLKCSHATDVSLRRLGLVASPRRLELVASGSHSLFADAAGHPIRLF